jgi:heme exporter protein A
VLHYGGDDRLWDWGNLAMTLSTQNLALQRGHRILVENFDLTLASGEGIALRGANGSGKTTLLRALAGLHEPRAGTISGTAIDDGPPQISFLGHFDPIKAGQKLGDQLLFWANVSGREGKVIDGIVQQMGLSRQMGLQGGVLSAGQRRRASLARLLLEDRPIWLLDEPAAPLDGDGRTLLGEALDAHRAKGGMFIAAVHDDLPGLATQTIWLTTA